MVLVRRRWWWWWLVVTVVVLVVIYSVWLESSTTIPHLHRAPRPYSHPTTPPSTPPGVHQTDGSEMLTGHSPPVEKVRAMQERLALIHQVCRRYLQHLKRFSIANRLTFDTKHHIAYCRNAKAGTTSWLSRMLEWAGVDTSHMTTGQVHDAAHLTFPDPTAAQVSREMMNAEHTFFTVARHPFSRLVSAYKDKILNNNYRRDVQIKMTEKYRKTEGLSDLHDVGTTNVSQQQQQKHIKKSSYTPEMSDVVSSQKSLVGNYSGEDSLAMLEAAPFSSKRESEFEQNLPTFREFVLYASDQVVACIPHISQECHEPLDVHWQPLHDRCAPCDISYDVIVKVETLEEDELYLSQVTGLPLATTSRLHSSSSPTGPASDTPTRTGVSANSITTPTTRDYFSTLSPTERKKVYEAYYFDFKLFGYSYNDTDYDSYYA